MKKLLILSATLGMALCLSLPASALEVTVDVPAGPEYASSTSVVPINTADCGEERNEDVSKNAALIPPSFGSFTSNLPGSGDPLTPNLTGTGLVASGCILGGITSVVYPGSSTASPDAIRVEVIDNPSEVFGFTPTTVDLCYNGGHLGTLKIPRLGVNVKVYQGTDSSTLAKGAGHFPDTSIWQGNVAIAGHNRGANCYFGEIHTLSLGDTITLTTKLGTRTYAVTSVSKVSETDNSMLAATSFNQITLITCVRGQSSYRWCVQATEVK